MKVSLIQHIKKEWFRYGFETLAVIVGILAAFALDNWNDERQLKARSRIYTEKLIEDLVTDTMNINDLIARCKRWQMSVDSYFTFFDQGGNDLDVLLDSASNVFPMLFRYLPVNYTFTDMQSSGNTNLLNEAQRKALIELSNEQEYLQIIIEKVITDIKSEMRERNHYLDGDRSPRDFYSVISIQQDVNDKVRGLKYQHNVLSLFGDLYDEMFEWGDNIKEYSRNCIELLSEE